MTRAIIALLCFFALPTAGEASDDQGARNLALLKQYGELGRRGEYAQQAAMWAPGAINNGHPMSSEEIRSQLEDIHRTFPDHRSEALETTVAGDLVIVLSRTSGTHRGVAQTGFYGGMLRGARPTEKRFEILRAHWWRFRDGKIVWHQVVSDDLAMMRQLGLIADTLAADKLVAPTAPNKD
jgi:predicted ester cyclase